MGSLIQAARGSNLLVAPRKKFSNLGSISFVDIMAIVTEALAMEAILGWAHVGILNLPKVGRANTEKQLYLV